MAQFFLGLDLGKRQDHSALAVVERSERLTGRNMITYEYVFEERLDLRLVEQLRLGTDYPSVVEHVRRRVAQVAGHGECTLVVDSTGVGVAVVDLMRREGMGCRVAPVMITAGGRQTQHGDVYGVPRKDLLHGLRVAFERKALGVAARLGQREELVRELMAMRATGPPSRAHDDLVFATALALWGADRARPGVLGVGQRLL